MIIFHSTFYKLNFRNTNASTISNSLTDLINKIENFNFAGRLSKMYSTENNEKRRQIGSIKDQDRSIKMLKQKFVKKMNLINNES